MNIFDIQKMSNDELLTKFEFLAEIGHLSDDIHSDLVLYQQLKIEIKARMEKGTNE